MTTNTRNTITTHVLDTGLGMPARGVAVVLERMDAHGRGTEVGSGITDADGRVAELLAPGDSLDEGTYRLSFATGRYFLASHRESFYPEVTILFRVGPGAQHYHVPVLLSPFGFTTYRGS